MPVIRPRASASQCGEPRPASAGTKTTPPVEPASRASCSLSAASPISPSPSRSHWSAAPPTRTDPSAAYWAGRPPVLPRLSSRRPGATGPASCADVREDEGSGAVGGLHLARREAALTEERCLLISGDPGERHSCAEQRRLGDGARGGHDARQDRWIDGEEAEQLVVPCPSLEIEQHRARRIREVGDVRRSAGQVPGDPAVDGPERELRLRAGRPRSRIHSSLLAEKYGSQTRPVRSRTSSAGNAAHRSAVRRSCQTIAGCTGRPVARSHTMVVSRWFVSPIADSSSAPDPGVGERSRPRSGARSPRARVGRARPTPAGDSAARSRGSRARWASGRRRRRGRSCPSCPGRSRAARAVTR